MERFEGEILKCLDGTSNFTEDMIAKQIRRYQQELDDAKAEYAALQNARLNEAAEIRKLRTYYDEFRGWAEEFDAAPLEIKRMILSQLIERVEVGRKYQVTIKLNGMEPEWYLTGVQSLGTMYALPSIIALFGSYIICRESQEDVLKSLLLIPVNMGKMVVAKVMVILVFSVGTYFVLFLAAFAVEMAFHAQVLTAAIFWHYLKIYLVDGICVFFAVLPIICFITEKKLDYWLSLLAAEVYSFITIFVGNLGTISKLYPLVAAFTLSGYYESTPAEILLSVISMVLCGMISGILIYRLSKRDALQ